ncbi:MAG: hypothetical protein H7066_09675 [Cytophagaceae bacterium]|nr:hypothetical protein [Gemmatimonadaceae bacterium]
MRIIQRMAAAAALVFAVSAQAGAAPTHTTPQASLQAPVTFALTAAQDPPPAPAPNVTVTTKTTTWYADPMWVTVAVLGAALIIGVIIAASRSGGRSQTTVIK